MNTLPLKKKSPEQTQLNVLAQVSQLISSGRHKSTAHTSKWCLRVLVRVQTKQIYIYHNWHKCSMSWMCLMERIETDTSGEKKIHTYTHTQYLKFN